MKKIMIIYSLGLLAILCSCQNHIMGDWDPIKFKPEKIKLMPGNDTVLVKANKWLDMVYGKIYPLNENGNLDIVIYPNKTEDTLTAGWMKAVALNNEEKREYIMKVITLEKNNTGKERGFVISVGHGPSFGSLLVLQPAK